MALTVKECLTNGNVIEYQVINGTAYRVSTPSEVVNILESAKANRQRIRVFYGDTETGRDWMEEYDVIGCIGRSTGRIKIPLLLKSTKSDGGGALLDDCIVKITIDKRVVYQHPKYYLGALTIRHSESSKYPYGVFCDGAVHANFKSLDRATKYVLFLKGESNRSF